jgi:hypothetical protein
MAQSNFKAIFENRNKPQGETAPPKRTTRNKIRGGVTQETKPPLTVTKGEKPLAKSKDPDFIQGNFYIRKTTHAQVKIKLLQQGEEKDLSDLVEELLTSWLAN